MAKQAKTLLLLAGAGIAAYLLWRKMKGGMPPPPPNMPPQGQVLDPVTEYPAAQTPGPTQTGQSAIINPQGGIIVPANIDPVVYGTVLNWLQLDADPEMSVMAVNPVKSEFDGLYNMIVNNLWGQHGDVEMFWNTLYGKYHPNW